MRFLNTGGAHDEGGVSYPRGTIVTTDKDLCALFANHFERLPDETPPTSALGTGEAAKVEEKSEAELGLPQDDDEETAAATTTTEEHVQQVKSNLGNDVTDDYALAEVAEVKVFRNGKRFFVTNLTDVNKALNEEPLMANQVKAFIKNLQPE